MKKSQSIVKEEKTIFAIKHKDKQKNEELVYNIEKRIGNRKAKN